MHQEFLYWFKLLFHTINILVIKWLCIINVFLKLNTVFICYVYMWVLVVCAVFDTLILKTKSLRCSAKNAKSLLIYVCITSGYRTSHSNAHFTPNTNLVDTQRCMESYNAIVLMQALPTMKSQYYLAYKYTFLYFKWCHMLYTMSKNYDINFTIVFNECDTENM